MVKKIVVIGVIGVLMGMSTVPLMGALASENFVNTADLNTNNTPAFWETVSSLGFQTTQQQGLLLEPPGIHFPLPGEVFRVGDVVEINGTASLPEFQSYLLEWGEGLTPIEWSTDGITLVNNGTVEIINATLGFWDTTGVVAADVYTIKLTITLTGSGEENVTVSVYLDPTLHQNFPFGWPHEIQGSQVAIWSPIALSDINHDGYQEIGFGTVTVVPAGDNNDDYVLDHNGNILPGWPIPLYGIQGASLTFADIESAPSTIEVIGGMWGDKIYVWHEDGTVVNGWPRSLFASRSSATVVDLDGNGDLEIVLPSTDGGGKVYAWHHDGTTVNGWPVSIGSPIRSAVSTADIDQDGFPEILFGDQNGVVHALHNNGSVVDGWPQQAHDFIKSSPVIADLEGDGDLEVIVCSGFTEQRIISVWHHDGTMMDGWPVENGLSFAQPSVGDLDGDGDLEILVGGAIPNTPYGRFYVWHHNGVVFEGWPITFPWDGSQYLDYIYAQPVIGDIDGDADMEIIAGSYAKRLYAWHEDATNVTGWPKRIGDSVDSTAAIADIDADGLVEVVVAGDDGKIYVWDMSGMYNASNMEWPMYQYDAHHTGCYGSITHVNQPPAAPTITGPAKGKVKVATAYNFTTVDPDGDEVYYFIDWGDSTNSGWVGPYPSGEVIVQSHTWSKKGAYTIQAKAKDSQGKESGWGTVDVTMPCSFVIPFQSFWERLFERFPHLFPFLREALQRGGLYLG